MPSWLAEAFTTVCPFCGSQPVVDCMNEQKVCFACRDGACPVQPEGPVANIYDAALGWTFRAREWRKLLNAADLDISKLTEMECYGMAKRFHIGVNQLEPLGPSSLED